MSDKQNHQQWVKGVVRDIMKKRRELAQQGSLPGRPKLPPEIETQLTNWLESGQPLREFFELNVDILGDPAQYNLGELIETDKEWLRRVGCGRRDLPDEFAVSFKAWLEAGQPAQEYFELNPELGDPSQYNLAQFLETDREWLERIQA